MSTTLFKKGKTISLLREAKGAAENAPLHFACVHDGLTETLESKEGLEEVKKQAKSGALLDEETLQKRAVERTGELQKIDERVSRFVPVEEAREWLSKLSNEIKELRQETLLDQSQLEPIYKQVHGVFEGGAVKKLKTELDALQKHLTSLDERLNTVNKLSESLG
jgi:hypothetical protein